MGGGHQQILDIVVLDGLHSLDALAAPVLGFEVVHRHALDVPHIRQGDYCILPGDQVLHGEICLVIAYLAAPVIAVFVGNFHDFLLDDPQQQFLVRQNLSQLLNPLLQLLMFILNLLPFQSGESAQPHLHNGLGLGFRKLESLHQPFFGHLGVLAAADDGYHFVYEIQSLQKSLYDMVPLLGLVQIVLRPSGDHFLLML